MMSQLGLSALAPQEVGAHPALQYRAPPQKKKKCFDFVSGYFYCVGAFRKVSATTVSVSPSTKNGSYSLIIAKAFLPLTPQLVFGTQSSGAQQWVPQCEGLSRRVVWRLSGNTSHLAKLLFSFVIQS